ncbi:MAG: hypothetical protein ABSF03_23970 [Streptosporangiaceae bacterium]|jgi:hypothetical protein
MADVGYVLLMVGFVVLAALFTIGCDKIIGPDEVAIADDERDDPLWGSRTRQPVLTWGFRRLVRIR